MRKEENPRRESLFVNAFGDKFVHYRSGSHHAVAGGPGFAILALRRIGRFLAPRGQMASLAFKS